MQRTLLALLLATSASSQDLLVAGPSGLYQIDRQGNQVRHVPMPPGAGSLDTYTDLIDLPDGTWLARYRSQGFMHTNNWVEVIDGEGTRLEEWWVTGSPLGRSLSVHEDGTPVVVESKTHGVLLGLVQTYSSDGDPLELLAMGDPCVGGLVAPDGSLVVGRWHSWSLEVYWPDGSLRASFAVEAFRDLDLAPDGTVWLLGMDQTLRRYNLAGTVVASIPTGAQAMAVDSDGSLWLSTGEHIDAQGNDLGSVALPQPVARLNLVRGLRPAGQVLCPGQPNSTGTAGQLEAHGGTSATAEVLSLTASHLPPQTLAALLVSTGVGSLPGFRGGEGTLCLDRARLGMVGLKGTDGAGRATWDPDLDLLPIRGGHLEVLAGSSWAWQVWYLDPGAGKASNLTGAVRVTFE